MLNEHIFTFVKYGVIILAAGTLLKVILSQLGGGSRSLPYKKNNYLFTKAERSFYHVLNPVVKELDLHLFAKVRLSDLVYVTRKDNSKMTYFNKIKAKHIDFVLCDKENISPILAIELDDASHNRADRVNRDIFVNRVMEVSGLPILHIKAKQGYNPNELKQAIMEKIKPAEEITLEPIKNA